MGERRLRELPVRRCGGKKQMRLPKLPSQQPRMLRHSMWGRWHARPVQHSCQDRPPPLPRYC